MDAIIQLEGDAPAPRPTANDTSHEVTSPRSARRASIAEPPRPDPPLDGRPVGVRAACRKFLVSARRDRRVSPDALDADGDRPVAPAHIAEFEDECSRHRGNLIPMAMRRARVPSSPATNPDDERRDEQRDPHAFVLKMTIDPASFGIGPTSIGAALDQMDRASALGERARRFDRLELEPETEPETETGTGTEPEPEPEPERRPFRVSPPRVSGTVVESGGSGSCAATPERPKKRTSPPGDAAEPSTHKRVLVPARLSSWSAGSDRSSRGAFPRAAGNGGPDDADVRLPRFDDPAHFDQDVYADIVDILTGGVRGGDACDDLDGIDLFGAPLADADYRFAATPPQDFRAILFDPVFAVDGGVACYP